MHILKEDDYLEVSIYSLIADYDRYILTNLYQPIIGYKAVSLYFTLLSEAENQKYSPILSHKSMFLRMQINAGDFVDARQLLEGVGLLKTFVSDLKENKLYHYELYAPKTPKLFFDNTLLYGMLIKTIGESEANKIKNIYLLNRNVAGKEITSTFMEVFTPDFDDPAFIKASENTGELITRASAKMHSGFSYEIFANYINERSQINIDSFSKDTMKEIERLATLYGVKEENAGEMVIQIYNPYAKKEERIDFEELARRFMDETKYRSLRKGRNSGLNGKVSSETDLARKINLMEQRSPKEYLSVLQNGTIPALTDLNLINDISVRFNLPNSVINALIDYVLHVANNTLPRALTEKVAASLAREGVQTAVDAMSYLKKASAKGRKKKINKVEEEPDKIVSEESPKQEESLDWDTLIKDFEEGNDNGED